MERRSAVKLKVTAHVLMSTVPFQLSSHQMQRTKHINLKHVGFVQIKGNNATLEGFYSGVYPRTSFFNPLYNR